MKINWHWGFNMAFSCPAGSHLYSALYQSFLGQDPVFQRKTEKFLKSEPVNWFSGELLCGDTQWDGHSLDRINCFNWLSIVVHFQIQPSFTWSSLGRVSRARMVTMTRSTCSLVKTRWNTTSIAKSLCLEWPVCVRFVSKAELTGWGHVSCLLWSKEQLQSTW